MILSNMSVNKTFYHIDPRGSISSNKSLREPKLSIGKSLALKIAVTLLMMAAKNDIKKKKIGNAQRYSMFSHN